MGCSICGKKIEARGWCSGHYNKWKRWGDPLANMKPQRSIEDLFSEYMPGDPPPAPSLTEGCWVWTLSTQNRGYGRFTYIDDDGKKRHMLAHRASHIVFIGPIPSGLFVLHSCDRPICVQPAHLRAGTNGDNMLDMWGRNRRDRSTAWGHHLR